jgi:hemoglobin-like flavoprotein
MQLSESSLLILRETAPPIAAAIDAISLRFYRRLFDAHPELNTDLQPQPPGQRRAGLRAGTFDRGVSGTITPEIGAA